MKHLHDRFKGARLWRQLLLFCIALPFSVWAATLDLTTVPLATATNTSVKPNLMFILDNSGSMEWNYMPDWVSGGNVGTTYYCKGSNGTANTECATRLPLFHTASFNGAAYNPETTYSPPKAYDGTELTSYSGTGSVPYDGYGKVSTSTLNLLSQYPDVEYCTSGSYSDCLRNDNYLLPGTVDGKNYTTKHDIAAYGTAKFATGAVGSATATSTATAVGPYYYVMVPGEYCSDRRLTTCNTQNAPDTTYPYSGGLRWCSNTALTACQGVWTTTYKYARYPTVKASSGGAIVPGSLKRFNIVSANAPFTNYVENGATIINRKNRTDCDAVTPDVTNNNSTRSCTYAQELRNFANWFAWYQTRIQMMKTSVSLAFQSIDNQYRVGFYTINNPTTNYLKIDTFKGGAGEQKNLWYNKLLTADAGSGTPLRSALANVGRIYAGKNPLSQSSSDDPVQYSCQQNFAILTTDGYWNTDSTSTVKKVDGGSMGNMDGSGTARPMYEGTTASTGSLADVAMYYYTTDLRTTAFGNCTGAEGIDVCENNVYVSTSDNNTQQHMTTFTLGLGIDGTLQYQKDYKTASSGDYYNIKMGSGSPSNWPVPAQNTATAVDDLWHAAVNGRGSYFSAKNASELSEGLSEALSTMNVRRGAGGAAATSSQNPISGDNYAYVASYTTVKWIGNLEARTINLSTGDVSENATWCVEDIYASSCTSPSYTESATSGATYCVTPSTTAAACTSGTFDSSDNTCRVSIATTCTGTLKSKVAAASDTRAIYTAQRTAAVGAPLGANFALTNFLYDNLTSAQQAYFSAATLSAGLTQWSELTTTQQSAAVGANLVNYLRGQTGYEERSANATDNHLFRYREAVMGDAMESEPVYLAKPKYSYTDDGYSDYVTAQTNRSATVYIGTNDGMLHAFKASDGTERWAFVPSMVIPNMWKLADKKYATLHANFVNGSPKVTDVYDAATSSWKTILVSGLNGGGRGYYALDVTNPASPSLLWEIDSSMDGDIGYTYGQPIVTKKSDGTWVVMFTSGYNNTDDGKGYLFVRNAITGAAIDKISTGVGSSTTPSGLAKISGWAAAPTKNNTTTYVYAGDLLGNVWRFDINTTTVADKVKKFAVLKDASGNMQPVTTEPELAEINSKRVVFVGTGKYLETTDLVNTQTQTLYAITDDESGVSLDNPRSSTQMVAQTLTNSGTSGTRTLTVTAVDWTTKRGWYVDFPDSGERMHVDPTIDGSLLFVATTVPSETVCSPGGYGWLNYFNYKMSTSSTMQSAVKFDGPIVGVNVFYTPDGQRRVVVTTSNNPTPKSAGDLGTDDLPRLFQGRRAIWREITPPTP